jgi:hypothetical protein
MNPTAVLRLIVLGRTDHAQSGRPHGSPRCATAINPRPAVLNRQFDSIMPKTLASAGVDRLLHHAHLILTSGESFRLIDAKNGGGVVPLVSNPTE